MTDDIQGNRFYGHNEPGWHGKGFVTTKIMTAQEVLAVMGVATVNKVPHMVTLNGIAQQHGFDLIRSAIPDDPQEKMFGYVTDDYNVLQPADFARLFDENVKQPVETLGFLGNGEQMFITWRLPSFDVVTGDTIELFGFIPIGFDGKIGARICIVTIRVVCRNTWNMAIAQAENSKDEGRGVIWSGRHTSPNLAEDLGAWLEHVQTQAEQQTELCKNFFAKLNDIPLSLSDASNIVYDVYQDPAPIGNIPDRIKARKTERREERLRSIETIRGGILDLFGGMGTQITPDAYGLFNATTEFLNHGLASKKDTVDSILIGNRHKYMNEMANYLMKL